MENWPNERRAGSHGKWYIVLITFPSTLFWSSLLLRQFGFDLTLTFEKNGIETGYNTQHHQSITKFHPELKIEDVLNYSYNFTCEWDIQGIWFNTFPRCHIFSSRPIPIFVLFSKVLWPHNIVRALDIPDQIENEKRQIQRRRWLSMK